MEEKNSSRFLELVNSARKSLSAGDLAAAGEFAELLVKEFPKSEKGWLVLASISKPEKALAYLENALRVNPNSQAARQAIRLITGQLLNGDQTVAEIPEILALEDTQPIKVNEIIADDEDSVAILDDLNELDSPTETQEISDLEDKQVPLGEIDVDITPEPENPDETSLVEEFPEVQPDLPVHTEAEDEREIVKQESINNSDVPTVEKKIWIRTKKAKIIDQPQIEPVVEPLKIVKADQRSQRKKFNVEIVELYLIAGFAVLLPILLFIYFYLSTGCQPMRSKLFDFNPSPSEIFSEDAQTKVDVSKLPAFKPMQFAWFYKPPENITELSTVASNYSLFILTRNDEPERERMVENGAEGEMMQYLRFDAIMDPGDCQTKPFQNQAANLEGDFCIIKDEYRDWFLLDVNGDPVKLEEMGYLVMDPGNAEWQAFFNSKVLEFQKDPGWNGIVLDNVDASLGRYSAQNRLLARFPDDKSFQDAVISHLASLSSLLHKNQEKSLIANITFLKQPEVWFKYLAYLDGAMIENFAADWDSGYISESDWLNQLEIIEGTQAQGKIIILVTQGNPDDYNRMLFGLASFILVNNGNAYFRYSNDEAYRKMWWYPEFDLDLGQPLGPRYKESGVWRRDFEKGSVMADPLKHQAEIKMN